MGDVLRTAAAVAVLLCALATASARQVQTVNRGCFVDLTNGIRDIPGLKNLGYNRIGSTAVNPYVHSKAVFINSAQMTHELCTGFCSLGGFKVAGLQASRNCCCGNSYGSQGAGSGCNSYCSGNPTQFCGGLDRNTVIELIYPNKGAFVFGDRTLVGMSMPYALAYSTVSVRGLLECVYLCDIGCEAVIFNREQGLCHLLQYRLLSALPAAASSLSVAD